LGELLNELNSHFESNLQSKKRHDGHHLGRSGTRRSPEDFRSASAGEANQSNGSTEPYPIPWLDKNGSHNQPAGPNLEPSHIYDFKGRVARCSNFTGMGTDNKGNRIAFGSPTTDYGLMQGEYWAARTTQGGAFTHI